MSEILKADGIELSCFSAVFHIRASGACRVRSTGNYQGKKDIEKTYVKGLKLPGAR